MPAPRSSEDPARPSPGKPLSLSVRPLPDPEALPGTTSQRLEFSARGERVSVRLLAPHSGGVPRPLALFVHDEVEAKSDASVRRALESGAAVLDVNWPLTGTRRSPKMSRQLIAAFGDGRGGHRPSPLLAQFFAQAREELACLLLAASELSELDAERILRIDLRLVTERSLEANANDELFAATGPARTFVREDLETGLSPEGGKAAIAKFLESLGA